MINAQNAAALDYWKHTLVDEEKVNAVCRDLDSRTLFGKLIFKADGEMKAIVSNRLGDCGEGHFLTVMNFFRAVAAQHSGEPLDGTIHVFLEDGLWIDHAYFLGQVPVFSFGKYVHDTQSFIMPDPAFLGSNAYASDKKSIDIACAESPWEQKTPTFFWRGASSNREFPLENWQDAQRFRFCVRGKEFDAVDAKISKVVDFGGVPSEKALYDYGIVGNYVPFEEFVRSKFLVDIDGMCSAWMSFFKKMYSNCATVKMDSDYWQWFYHQVVPWEHYIPFRNDLNDLEELIEWALAHDTRCKEIAENGRNAVAALTVEAAIAETYHLLRQFFGYQRALAGTV
jgi:hypothetical protein